ncbi:hypothetical protein HH110_05975, partial [Stenotrophomonas sp. SAM-B]|nr:hypothetical protein [Stenotrophomonas sp. SAM-B]
MRTHSMIARTLLSSAVMLALFVPDASADIIGPGNTRTVGPGSPIVSWVLQQDSTLNVLAGGATSYIQAQAGSTVNLQGATVTGDDTTVRDAIALVDSRANIVDSTISSATRSAISLGYAAGTPDPGSRADIRGGTITGAGEGAISLSGNSTLTLAGTTVRGVGTGPYGGNAVWSFGGVVEVAEGSTLIGDQSGIFVGMSDAGTLVPDAGTVLVDASSVEGIASSAIVVQTLPSSARQDVSILVRNGSVLKGGDGNLLLVRNAFTAGDASVANFQVESSVLNGNVVAEDMAEAHVTLLNGGRINGRFDNVTTATIGDGGHWQLTGDSDVGQLALGPGGVVALGDGTAFNTLTITGDYTGSGGTLLFNTVLGDDTAASDKL